MRFGKDDQLAALFAALLVGMSSGCRTTGSRVGSSHLQGHDPASRSAPTVVLDSLAPLRDRFNGETHKIRVVAIFSPT